MIGMRRLRKRMIRIRLTDGMRQEVYSKGKEMHNKISGLWFLFLKRKINEFQYKATQQRSNFGDSQ